MPEAYAHDVFSKPPKNNVSQSNFPNQFFPIGSAMGIESMNLAKLRPVRKHFTALGRTGESLFLFTINKEQKRRSREQLLFSDLL
jgi:hypothetical protein